jgi:formate dehydrogenase major subunit
MDKLTITIDGAKVTTSKGTTVLQAALDNGIYIPHLCHHPDLDPVGICRICMVDIDGRMVISCKTKARDGMAVKTETPEVDQVRRIAAELLVANHPMNCLSCSKDTDCQLQRVANYVGIDEERMQLFRRTTRTLPIDTSNPFFDRDLSKCVLCGICIRTCDEIQGVNAIDYALRGLATTVATLGNKPLSESPCESCGECLVRCPVGALTPRGHQRPAREVKTVCTYCGVGCSLYLGVRGDKIVGVRGDVDSPVNQGSLCVKGRFGYEFINHPDRLTAPLIRKNGELVEATWEEALDLVARKFSEHKGEEFATVSSARSTSEDNYIIQKLTRAVMGANNIDHCARL